MQILKWYAFLLSLTLLLAFSCQSSVEKKDIRSYYFPLDSLEQGRVYEYVTIDVQKQDTLSIRYNYYKSMQTDSGQVLITNTYNALFFNDQYIMEEIVGNGSLLRQYHLMAMRPESDKPVIEKAQITQNNAFPFFVSRDGGVTPMEMRFKDPSNPKERIRFMRERKYLRDTLYTYQGQDIPAVIFSANEIQEFSNEDEGDFDNINYATEIYAQGLGLISRRYHIGDTRMEMTLRDTFGMEYLEQLARQFWPSNDESQ